jgi:hypothetical protein
VIYEPVGNKLVLVAVGGLSLWQNRTASLIGQPCGAMEEARTAHSAQFVR